MSKQFNFAIYLDEFDFFCFLDKRYILRVLWNIILQNVFSIHKQKNWKNMISIVFQTIWFLDILRQKWVKFSQVYLFMTQICWISQYFVLNFDIERWRLFSQYFINDTNISNRIKTRLIFARLKKKNNLKKSMISKIVQLCFLNWVWHN